MTPREPKPTPELTPEEKAIARRWCIFNSWGWPDDVREPNTEAECLALARSEMEKAVRVIGMKRCLAFWNSEEFAAMQPIRQVFGARR